MVADALSRANEEEHNRHNKFGDDYKIFEHKRK